MAHIIIQEGTDRKEELVPTVHALLNLPRASALNPQA